MKEDIKKYFSQSQNLTFDRINWEKQEKFDELHVTLFSYLFYKQYIEFENKIENISYFIKEDEEMNNEEILENLLEEISNQIDNESIYLNFNENDENFKDVLKTLKTILINKYKFQEFDLVKNEKKIKEIVKNFLYVKKNKKLSKDYINSNIEDTIKELKYTINNAAEYHSNDRNFQIVDFVINVYTSFHDIKMRIVDEQYSINKKMLTSAHLDRVKNDIEKEYSLNYSNIQKVLSDLKFDCQKEIDQIEEYIGDCDTFPDEMNNVNKNVTDIFLYNLRKINEYLKSFYNKSEKILFHILSQLLFLIFSSLPFVLN